MFISYYSNRNIESEGQRCRSELLETVTHSRNLSGEAELEQGSKRVDAYLNAYGFIDRTAPDQAQILRRIVLPPLQIPAYNQYLRRCCGLDPRMTGAKSSSNSSLAEKKNLATMQLVKTECEAEATRILEQIRVIPNIVGAEGGVKLVSNAIENARIAWGSDSRKTAAFIKSVGTAARGDSVEESLKISSLPTGEEAANALDRLDAMTGLNEAKKGLRGVLANVRLNAHHKQRSMMALATTTNLVFVGPPGTGKTTAARLFAHALKHAGAVRTGQLVEVSRSDRVGTHIGHTEKRTRQALEAALGGVLFVDEAYTLLGEGQDFGPKALNEILSYMENHRNDLCVIFAGYQRDIDKLLDNNEGMRSRFKGSIHFDSYSDQQLRSS